MSNLVAGVEALRHRVETGRWDSVAESQELQQVATSLGIGAARFVHYEPRALSGDNGPFHPRKKALP